MVATDTTIDRVIERFRLAAEASRATAGREGGLIVLDESAGEDIVVTTDLHGQRLNFAEILRQIDWPSKPDRHLIMQEVCHGGPAYPQGGCMSHLLLEDIAQLKIDHPNRFYFLISNHELAELTDFPIAKSNRMLNLIFRSGMQVMYGERCEEVREAMYEFLRECPLGVRLSNGVFISHSTPAEVDTLGFDVSVFERTLNDLDLQSGGEVFRLVWGRDFREENAEAFCRLIDAEVLLNGHEPCNAGVMAPNRRQVIIDSCAPRAHVAVLPLAGQLNQQDVLARVRPLFPLAPADES